MTSFKFDLSLGFCGGNPTTKSSSKSQTCHQRFAVEHRAEERKHVLAQVDLDVAGWSNAPSNLLMACQQGHEGMKISMILLQKTKAERGGGSCLSRSNSPLTTSADVLSGAALKPKPCPMGTGV